MYKTFCDSCKKLIPEKRRRSCRDCGDDLHYHPSCLKKIDSQPYCVKHEGDHIEGGLLVTYLKQVWKRLNIGGKIKVPPLLDDDNGHSTITVNFENRTSFSFRAAWDHYSKTYVFTYEDTVYRLKPHHHATFRKALKDFARQAVVAFMNKVVNNIKLSTFEIKKSNASLKKLAFLLDVVEGRKKWPKSKPEETVVLKL